MPIFEETNMGEDLFLYFNLLPGQLRSPSFAAFYDLYFLLRSRRGGCGGLVSQASRVDPRQGKDVREVVDIARVVMEALRSLLIGVHKYDHREQALIRGLLHQQFDI